MNDWEAVTPDRATRRLAVPGGWLYTDGVALCFVPGGYLVSERFNLDGLRQFAVVPLEHAPAPEGLP